MLRKKYYLYLSETEHTILVNCLVEMKTKLIQQNRFTDCVDDLLKKVITAPRKNIKISMPPTVLYSKRPYCFQGLFYWRNHAESFKLYFSLLYYVLSNDLTLSNSTITIILIIYYLFHAFRHLLKYYSLSFSTSFNSSFLAHKQHSIQVY